MHISFETLLLVTTYYYAKINCESVILQKFYRFLQTITSFIFFIKYQVTFGFSYRCAAL